MQKTHKITIVYAEDSKSISHIVKSRLIFEGYDVIHFADGRGVVEEVLKTKPTFVLLDNDMPVKNGLTIAEELKNMPETKDIPIIFLTTRHDQYSVVKCLELGIADYIIKDSLAISEIITRIQKLLK